MSATLGFRSLSECFHFVLLDIVILCIYLLLFFSHTTLQCRIFISHLETELMLPRVKEQNPPNHWATKKVPNERF